jgi:hypothetical protein
LDFRPALAVVLLIVAAGLNDQAGIVPYLVRGSNRYYFKILGFG